METFLQKVAKHLLDQYGKDLAHTAVVFPNKRAALFLNQALARLSDGPLWSPSYMTISDLFRAHTTLTVADPILTIALLYKSYVKVTKSTEPFEQFYPWGQLLLADFDDIDKNLVDARIVFRNLCDYHEYDGIDLTDEQRALLKRFFRHFTDDNSQSSLYFKLLKYKPNYNFNTIKELTFTSYSFYTDIQSNGLYKLDDDRIVLFTTKKCGSTEHGSLNMFLSDIYENYTKFKAREYTFSYTNKRFAKEMDASLYNGYILFTATLGDSNLNNIFSIMMIFGYANGTVQTIDISPYLMDTGYYDESNNLYD